MLALSKNWDIVEKDMRFLLILVSLLLSCSSFCLAKMPSYSQQAIIGVADDWKSTTISLSLVEKNAQGQWQQVLGPYPARLGRSGLIWGLGLNALPKGAQTKNEGDGYSPAGIFHINRLFLSMNQNPKRDSRWPTVNVTPADIWVSDLTKPQLYNQHFRLDHPASSDWEKKEMMRQNDHAHSLKLEICHNSTDVKGRPVVGKGSSIFFHIWRRNGQATTAGCTSMDEDVLKAFIRQLKPEKRPVYILLPRNEYMKYRQAWQLP